MVAETKVTTVCDLPHDDEVEGDSYSFGVDNEFYEIDACGPHWKSFQDELAAFLDNARPAGPKKYLPMPGKSKYAQKLAKRPENERIRARAAEAGIQVKPGRIPTAIREKFGDK